MIRRHVGGEIVKGGVYWSKSGGEFITVPAEGGILAGGSRDRYIGRPCQWYWLRAPSWGWCSRSSSPVRIAGAGAFPGRQAEGSRRSERRSNGHPADAAGRILSGVPFSRAGRGKDGAQGEEKGKLVDLARR